MSDQHLNASTVDLRRYMNEPRREDPALRMRIQAFVLERLRFVHQRAGWSNWTESGRWSFMFDEHGHNVPEALGDEQSAATSARWIWTFAVSERGPLITCETFSLMTEVRDGVEHQFYGPDLTSRANALAWTQQIVQEFGLHYVDAKMLRDWEVSYGEVDPEFDLEHNVLAAPNAFQVLFYE